MKKRCRETLQKLLSTKLTGTAFVSDGANLGDAKGDTYNMSQAFTIWLWMVLDTVWYLHHTLEVDFMRRARRIIVGLPQVVDYSVLARALSEYDNDVIHSVGTSPTEPWRYTRHGGKDLQSTWLRGVMSDLSSTNPEVETWGRWTQLHSICCFLSRLTIRSDRRLADTSFTKYIDNLNRVRAVTTWTTEEKLIIQDWLQDFELPSEDDCAFGNGSTSLTEVGADASQKWSREHFRDTARTHLLATRLGLEPYGLIEVRPVASKIQLVPKSYKINRVIAMEDPMLSYYQHGLLKSFDRLFLKKLRRRIDLHDEGRSRVKAQEGSAVPSMYATIDLSSASDSVANGLVQSWFAGTVLEKILPLARTTHGYYEDKRVEFPQYASMGSTICFPLECIVFAAQCEATIAASGVDPRTSHYCVYGDDIVIESEFAPALIARLERNGFSVNEDKSYYSDLHFREACGGEYAWGHEVTPVRISRRFDAWSVVKRSKPMNGPIIKLANSLFLQGFSASRRYVLSLLRDVAYTCDLNELWDEDGNVSSSLIFSPTATNSNLVRRWNEKLQKSEFRVRGMKAEYRTFGRDATDEARYYYVLHSPEPDDPLYGMSQSRDIRRPTLHARVFWV